MTGKTYSLIISLFLVFIIDAATCLSWVEDLKMKGEYGGSYCNADVTCYVFATDPSDRIEWKCLGCPFGVFDMRNVPGFDIKAIESYSYQKYRQTISITKCYSRLELTCSSGSTRRSITLTSGGLSVGAIVGIVFGVIFVLCLVAGCIGLARRKKTRGVVVGGGFVNPVNINPPPGTYPTHPQPMVYPGDPATYATATLSAEEINFPNVYFLQKAKARISVRRNL